MNQVWTRDSAAIRDELRLAARLRLPVVLTDGKRRVLAGRLQRLVPHGEDHYLVIQRHPRFFDTDPAAVKWVSYKFANRPIVTFPAVIERAFKDLLACPMPSRLYFRQRRRHSRYFIKNHGVAAFFVANRARVCRMRLADISLGGARLVGMPRYDLGYADRLGPATFSVVTEGEPIVKEVTISQATVVRNQPRSGSEFEVGIRFFLDRSERLALARLLTDPFGPRMFSRHPAVGAAGHTARPSVP